MYGAAYYPYLQTTLNYHTTDDSVEAQEPNFYITDAKGIRVTCPASDNPKIKIDVTTSRTAPITFIMTTSSGAKQLEVKLPKGGSTPDEIVSAWNTHPSKGNFDIEINGDGTAKITADVNSRNLTAGAKKSLTNLKSDEPEHYNQVKAALAKKRLVLPSSSAIAGVYAMVDRDRGVWKAPANVSLSGVITPTIKITGAEQENLNIDTSGKSINAIRSFAGKGTLVWGARTLAGNDNEWRYISVRRLFNMIEESIQKSTAFAVFEPNDDMTWLKVRAMIESYLDGLWRQGALAGTAPEQ
ncbi:MAG: phage tail sheath family protein, partial [Deltaproteobacteria bacterium]|nr:phage tail sheath family protein [Deltaproteobacteria bacterium]